MKTLKLAFLLALFVAQVAVSLPVTAQNPRINRQQPGGGMEGGGHEQVEQPVRPARPSPQKPGWATSPGQSALNVLQIQPNIYLTQTSPTGLGMFGQPLGPLGGSAAAGWPSQWANCPEAFWQHKDRRVLQEMERQGQTIFLNSIDGPRFLPRGRVHAAGPPTFSGIYSNVPRLDTAAGLLWFEVIGSAPFQVLFQRCDDAGRPVGDPEISTHTAADEVLWPIPEATGCRSPGPGEIPVCSGPPIWFAVGDRMRFAGEKRFAFSISYGARKIATICTTSGCYYQYFQ